MSYERMLGLGTNDEEEAIPTPTTIQPIEEAGSQEPRDAPKIARRPPLYSVAITTVPIAAGYITYKKTDGSIPWTVAAAVGSYAVIGGIYFLSVITSFSRGY